MTEAAPADLAAQLTRHLTNLKALRGPDNSDKGFARRLQALKAWQNDRLAVTYQDLAATPRYAPAVAFFLQHLYGQKDFARRDEEMIRITPTLVRILPASAVETITLALELDVLSEQFDQALTKALPAGLPSITADAYCEAFRKVGNEAGRLRQVALVTEVGTRLDKVVKKRLVYGTLKMLRNPARLAGLGDLQDFLENGFTAFRHMEGADEFLATVARRESEVIRRILARHPKPFEVA